MNLQRIREITAYNCHAKPTEKAALRTWLTGLRSEFQFAVTLTMKQVFEVKTARGTHIKRLHRNDCDAIAKRFIQKLNRQVFGNAAERYGKSLRFIPIVEGERNGKNLHIHMAVGHFPKAILPMKFGGMVKSAACQVRELDEQHDVAVMDSGWMEYITKELSANDTDNVLWQLA